MSAEYNALALAEIQETITRLQNPISDLETLLALLTAPLDAINLLPPAFRRYNSRAFSKDACDSFKIDKYVPLIQTALLDSVVPTWEPELKRNQLEHILHQYFSPDAFYSATPAAQVTAICAYTTLLSFPIQKFSIDVLESLYRTYTVDQTHATIFSKISHIPSHRRLSTWDDLVRSIISIPLKVANKSGETGIPDTLQSASYYRAFCSRVEVLVSSISRRMEHDTSSSLTSLFARMVNVGLFPGSMELSPSQASFFSVTLPTIRKRIALSPSDFQSVYTSNWSEIYTSLPLTLLAKVLTSFVTCLAELPTELDTCKEARGLMIREGRLLMNLLGALEGDEDEKWAAVTSVMLMRSWNISKARILVCWAVLSDETAIPPHAVDTLLSRVMGVWSSPDHIKHSLLSHHQYLTTLLLLTITTSSPSPSSSRDLALSPAFISSISTYLHHLDPAVRRCGMLAAEIVAARSGKQLDFAQWAGEGQGREWARAVRTLVTARDVDAEESAPNVVSLEAEAMIPEEKHKDVRERKERRERRERRDVSKPLVQEVSDEGGYESEESLVGYESSGSSSRSPSPTPSELEEIEKDPTIHIGAKKIQRPVYLLDLAKLISESTKPDDPQNADKIKVALDTAEELIRRKRSYGLELEENAVNLVHILTSLQNNYELDGFDQKRQGAVTALVACCPMKAAPTIIEAFWKNQYSIDQRFAMLNALALGARELASLPVPPSSVDPTRLAFPSKQLPFTQHSKYIAHEPQNAANMQVRSMLEGISRAALESGRATAEAQLAEPLARERLLRIRRPAPRIVEVGSEQAAPRSPQLQAVPAQTIATAAAIPYLTVAEQYFLGPLLARFWEFFRDEQTRVVRASQRSSQAGGSYRGTGTGMILSPLVLSHFIGALAVLLHAARSSPAFRSVLAPNGLELALTIGTRSVSGYAFTSGSVGKDSEGEEDRDASVLRACLELALVVLDASIELDGGRVLGLEYTALLLDAGEWASKVLNALERGARVPGGGGAEEERLRHAAAGVVIKVEEIRDKWRQAMITA